MSSALSLLSEIKGLSQNQRGTLRDNFSRLLNVRLLSALGAIWRFEEINGEFYAIEKSPPQSDGLRYNYLRHKVVSFDGIKMIFETGVYEYDGPDFPIAPYPPIPAGPFVAIGDAIAVEKGYPSGLLWGVKSAKLELTFGIGDNTVSQLIKEVAVINENGTVLNHIETSNTWQSLFGALGGAPVSLTELPETQFVEGFSDEWPSFGKDDYNTAYMPSYIIRSNNALSLDVQRNSENYPVPQRNTTYHPVFDKTHIYAMCDARDSSAPVGVFGPKAYIAKINRVSGKIDAEMKMKDVFSGVFAEADISARSCPELDGDYLYVTTNGSKMGLAKLNKADLSVVWAINSKPEGVYHSARQCKVVHPTTGAHVGKTLIVCNFTTTDQYGNRFSENNYGQHYAWWKEQGSVRTFVDNGDSCELLWEFKVGPKMYQVGDTVGPEAFGDGLSSMKILYPLVNITKTDDDGNVTDTFDSTNYVSEGGVKGFQFDATNAGTYQFDKLDADKKNVIATGAFTLNAGDVLLSGADNVYTSDDSSMTVTGEEIFFGQPIIKTINVGHVIADEYEMRNLNYYGGGFYAPICFDDANSTVYVASANGHYQPYDDGLRLQEDNTITDAAYQYTYAVSEFYEGNVEVADVDAKWETYKTVAAGLRSFNKSPRWRRFLVNSIIGLDINTGELKWADSANGYDPWTWQQDTLNAWTTSVKGANADISTGGTLVERKDDDGNVTLRKLFTSDKGAVVMNYNLMDLTNVSVTGVTGETSNQYPLGISAMVTPPAQYTYAGVAGPQGGAMFGACTDGKYYITHQLNVPFGSKVLEDFTINSILEFGEPGIIDDPSYPNQTIGSGVNKRFGYISDKVVPNDQTTLFKFDDTRYMIPSRVSYLHAVDVETGEEAWIAPLAPTMEVGKPFLYVPTVPTVSDNCAPRIVGDVAMCGLASGKLHFVDMNRGKLLKTMAFESGAAGGVCASRDTIYFQGGWAKWFVSDSQQDAESMAFITVNGQ